MCEHSCCSSPRDLVVLRGEGRGGGAGCNAWPENRERLQKDKLNHDLTKALAKLCAKHHPAPNPQAIGRAVGWFACTEKVCSVRNSYFMPQGGCGVRLVLWLRGVVRLACTPRAGSPLVAPPHTRDGRSLTATAHTAPLNPTTPHGAPKPPLFPKPCGNRDMQPPSQRVAGDKLAAD